MEIDTVVLLAIAAFLGAGFGVGADFIKQYIKTGKVTPDHLKKEDLLKMENIFTKQFEKQEQAFEAHLEKHGQCERDFLKISTFDKHIDECQIKQLSIDMKHHEIKHGSLEAEMNARLGSIEVFVKSAAETFEKFTERFGQLNITLELMVQRMDIYHSENPWNGTNRRDKKGEG